MLVSDLKPGEKFIDSVRHPSGGIGGLGADGPHDVYTRTSDPIENGRARAFNENTRQYEFFDASARVKHAYWLEPVKKRLKKKNCYR